MKKICNQCQTEMIEDLTIKVEGDTSGIKIRKKVNVYLIVFPPNLK